MPEFITLTPAYSSLFRRFLDDAAGKEQRIHNHLDVVQLSEWAASFNIALNSTYTDEGEFDPKSFIELRDHFDAFSKRLHAQAEVVRNSREDWEQVDEDEDA